MLPIDQGVAGHGKGIGATNGIACRWSLTCIAVGSKSVSVDGSMESVGDFVMISQRSPSLRHLVTGTDSLNTAACAGPEYCVATGSNSSNEGVFVTIAGSTIDGAPIVEGSTQWTSVSCSNVNFCIAIGGNSEGQSVFTTFGLPTG
jgi:hypothetical protein